METLEIPKSDTREYSKGFIVFTILAAVLIFVIVIIVGIFAYQSSTLSSPPKPLQFELMDQELYLDAGSSNIIETTNDASKLTISTCNDANNSYIRNGSCHCKAQYYGSSCHMEKHDGNFFNVGSISGNFSKFDSSKLSRCDKKSFTSDSCSSRCDDLDGCIGFIYENGTCQLLTETVVLDSDKNLTFSSDSNNSLFLRSSDNINFKNKIFLAEFRMALPPRYWLTKQTKYYKQLDINELSKLHFVPSYVLTNEKLVGIYSIYKFTNDDIEILIKRGNTSKSYIHMPNTVLSLPTDWVACKTGIYCVYIKYE